LVDAEGVAAAAASAGVAAAEVSVVVAAVAAVVVALAARRASRVKRSPSTRRRWTRAKNRTKSLTKASMGLIDACYAGLLIGFVGLTIVVPLSRDDGF
jgi:uncharacterized membrane-anchored protein